MDWVVKLKINDEGENILTIAERAPKEFLESFPDAVTGVPVNVVVRKLDAEKIRKSLYDFVVFLLKSAKPISSEMLAVRSLPLYDNHMMRDIQQQVIRLLDDLPEGDSPLDTLEQLLENSTENYKKILKLFIDNDTLITKLNVPESNFDYQDFKYDFRFCDSWNVWLESNKIHVGAYTIQDGWDKYTDAFYRFLKTKFENTDDLRKVKKVCACI